MEFQTIDMDMIDPNPNQPRKDFGDDSLQELAESIKQIGVLAPLLVRPLNGRYEIVHGERRWRAAKIIGLDQVPARVQPLSDNEAFIISLNENLQRQNLNPIEEAKAYGWLQDKGYSQAKIGEVIGKTQQYVASRLTLLRLPATVQEKITTHVVTPTHGEILVALNDPELEEGLAKKVEKEHMPTKELTDWVSLLKDLPTNLKSGRAHRELAKAVVRDNLADIRYKAFRKIELMESQRSFFEKHPELECYMQAVAKGELRVPYHGDKLEVASLKTPFIGQSKPWPCYSGMDLVMSDKYGERVRHNGEGIAVFSEKEWAEVTNYDMSDLGKMFPKLSFEDVKRDCLRIEDDPITRRAYDHNYGHFLLRAADKKIKTYAVRKTVYVRQGWGAWKVVAFNDGNGHRIRRKFFEQDFYDDTLVRQAFDTASPILFSDDDYNRLAIHRVQGAEACWQYFRKATESREKAIEALEFDLKKLKLAPILSEDQIEARALELLKEWNFTCPSWQFREGRISAPCLPDGSVDMGQYKNVRA